MGHTMLLAGPQFPYSCPSWKSNILSLTPEPAPNRCLQDVGQSVGTDTAKQSSAPFSPETSALLI